MKNELLNIAAEVLEKAAAYVDALEAEKQAQTAAERAKVAETLRVRYSEATGEELSDDMASKLAAAEPSVLELVEKLAGASSAPDSMGGPGNVRDDSSAPRTEKEAASAADERFVAWLQS